jgi:hypothetical protein
MKNNSHVARIFVNKRSLFITLSFLIIGFNQSHAQIKDPEIVPIIYYLLDDSHIEDPEFTDNLEVECSFELVSFSPANNSLIAVGDSFSVTLNYQISQRPKDVEIQITSSVQSSPGDEGGESEITALIGTDVIASIGSGLNEINGQVTLTNVNMGENELFDTASILSSCLAFTVYDAEDEMNNPGPIIGTRVELERSGLQSLESPVSWTFQPGSS